MPAARRSKVLTLFWRFHRWIFRVSGGRMGSRLFGNTILRLVTKGRLSQEPRGVMLYAFPAPSGHVVVASNAGADRHPAWYLNLQADPVAEVQVGREHRRVRAREAQGEERERLWSEIANRDQSYAEYQARTDRQIPVVILEPIDKMSD